MTSPLARRLARRTDRRVALATGVLALGGAAVLLAAERAGTSPSPAGAASRSPATGPWCRTGTRTACSISRRASGTAS